MKYKTRLGCLPCGIVSYKKHYCELDKGYYYIDFIILLIALMYLCRIKNPEQLSQINPAHTGPYRGGIRQTNGY